jgi:hypothetical protein
VLAVAVVYSSGSSRFVGAQVVVAAVLTAVVVVLQYVLYASFVSYKIAAIWS